MTMSIAVTGTYGFQGSVALSITGLPPGVSGWFTPTVVTAGHTAGLALTAAVWAGSPSAPVTVTGIGGGVTITLPLSLAVTAVPSFSLSPSASSVSVAAGSSTTATVLVIGNGGFKGLVGVLVSAGLPSGVTASVSPATVAAGSLCTLTLKAAASTAVSTASLTLRGSGGGLLATAPLTLNVTPGPGFTLAAAPAQVSVASGSSVSTAVSVAGTAGYSGMVTLSLSGLPGGLSAAFNPSVVSIGASGASASATSTLTITATAGASAVSANVTIKGVSAALSAATTFTVNATGVRGFTLTAMPPAVGLVQGGSATALIGVVGKGNFTGNVTLTLPGLPTGVTATFTPAVAATGTTATLVLLAAPSAAVASRGVTLTGTSGSISATAPLTVSVTASGFTLSTNPPSLTVVAGSFATTAISVTANGSFTGSVSLSVTGLPQGVSAAFNPVAIPAGGTATLRLTAAASALLGTANLALRGTYSSLAESAPLILNVVPAPGFSLIATPPTLTIAAGASLSSTVVVSGTGGFAGAVTLAVSGLRAGVTATVSPASVPAGGTATVTVTAAASSTASNGNISILGTGGGLSVQIPITVAVIAAPGFSLTPGASTLNVAPGATGLAGISVLTKGGYQGIVSLYVAGLPGGVTAAFTPSTTAVGGSAMLMITVAPSTGLSTSLLTITGISGNLSATTTISLTIAAPGFYLQAGATSLSVGDGLSVSTTVKVIPAYGFTGTVTLAATGLPCGIYAVFTPPSIPAGGTASLKLSSNFGAVVTTNIVITGTSGAMRATATLSLSADTDFVGFRLYANPYFVDLAPGGTATTTITMQPVHGYTGAATLVAPAISLPPGVTASISPSIIAPGSKAVMTLTASASAPLPSGFISVQGSAGNMEEALLRITLNNDVPGFTLEPPYLSSSVLTGIIDSTVIIDYSGGFSSPVQLSFSGLPPGVVGSFQEVPYDVTNTHWVEFELAAGVTAVASPPPRLR